VRTSDVSEAEQKLNLIGSSLRSGIDADERPTGAPRASDEIRPEDMVRALEEPRPEDEQRVRFGY